MENRIFYFVSCIHFIFLENNFSERMSSSDLKELKDFRKFTRLLNFLRRHLKVSNHDRFQCTLKFCQTNKVN
jgi:hypothetical protein